MSSDEEKAKKQRERARRIRAEVARLKGDQEPGPTTPRQLTDRAAREGARKAQRQKEEL